MRLGPNYLRAPMQGEVLCGLGWRHFCTAEARTATRSPNAPSGSVETVLASPCPIQLTGWNSFNCRKLNVQPGLPMIAGLTVGGLLPKWIRFQRRLWQLKIYFIVFFTTKFLSLHAAPAGRLYNPPSDHCWLIHLTEDLRSHTLSETLSEL